MLHLSSLPTRSLTIRPLVDEVIDSLGHDPRSAYAETYWLSVLGPSTMWLLRHLAAGLEESPAGYELSLADTARRLGLGDKGGRHSPFIRALARLVQFDVAVPYGRELSVRRKLPPLNRRQLVRLPPELQAAHDALMEANLQRPPFEQVRRRSRQLALSLLELGEDVEATERQLLRWRFHPALARESAEWAWDRHRQALAAAAGAGAGVGRATGVAGAAGGAAGAGAAAAASGGGGGDAA
ncbi:MAG TPA: hypothetical protein VGO92_05435 [Acidimicrobiales bacterium]|nr:hypothetical protein [Acidimicrobiales bacterium]